MGVNNFRKKKKKIKIKSIDCVGVCTLDIEFDRLSRIR